MIFEEDNIGVWAYNIETVLAEKVETIIKRGEFNTRPRDFYDVYILTKTQQFKPEVFLEAIKKTTDHRKSTHIFNEIENRVNQIKESDTLNLRWNKYTKDYSYAEGITYENVINSLNELIQYLK